jgi:hypothetical protein
MHVWREWKGCRCRCVCAYRVCTYSVRGKTCTYGVRGKGVGVGVCVRIVYARIAYVERQECAE